MEFHRLSERLETLWNQTLAGYYFPSAMIPLAAVLLALALHAVSARLVLRAVAGRDGHGPALVRKARRPLALVAVIAALGLSLSAVDLDSDLRRALQHLALVLVIVLTGWTSALLINHFALRNVERYRGYTDNDLRARKHVTQVRVLRRTANIVIAVFTATAVLLTFESVQRYGLSLFASAGAAGVILGLAARPVLANVIAGIQIAVTQPIHLDDVVIVEGEWGWIEEIFATYVVVRIWDWRRMVVPLSYFIETPFENWSREAASLIGSVDWHMDYSAPVGAIRDKLRELAEASPHWDGQVARLEVIDTDKDTMTVRALVSAHSAAQAWDLRCEIREKMLVWLQDTHPDALPRLRGELSLTPAGGGVPGNGRAPARAASGR